MNKRRSGIPRDAMKHSVPAAFESFWPVKSEKMSPFSIDIHLFAGVCINSRLFDTMNTISKMGVRIMIISASRRTDIPAFYSEWFMNRIRAGFFVSVNPFNPGQRQTVSLAPRDVEAIVFVSKNPGPLIKYLTELDKRGYNYIFQFTLNDYPEVFEPRVPSLQLRVDIFKRLSSQIGPEKIIWRYDPIIVSNITTVDYHIDCIARLAGELRGFSSRMIISFLDLYEKVKYRLDSLEKEHGIRVTDICAPRNEAEFHRLSQNLGQIAHQNGFEIYSCSEKADLAQFGIEHGSCIDGGYLNKLFTLNIPLKKSRSQRPECQCVTSVDMGVYHTCKFNCRYCYANGNESTVMKNAERHDPMGVTMG